MHVSIPARILVCFLTPHATLVVIHVHSIFWRENKKSLSLSNNLSPI